VSSRSLVEILEDVLVDDGERQFNSRGVFSAPTVSVDALLVDLRRELAEARSARRALEEEILFLKIENDRLRREIPGAGKLPCDLPDGGSVGRGTLWSDRSQADAGFGKASLVKTLRLMLRIALYAVRHPLTEGIVNIRTGKVGPMQRGS